MPDPTTLRQLALALPGTLEQPHHGFPSFRVQGRIYATLPDDDHAHLMLTPDAIGDAVGAFPGTCSEKWWGSKLAAVRVELATIPVDALSVLVGEAYARQRRG